MRSTRWILAALALAGCASNADDDDSSIVIPDDDDTSDDDDSVDDDDTSPGDDDDSVAETQVLIRTDIATGRLAFQDGDGPWTQLEPTGLQATALVTDPEGRYGLALSCAGTSREGTQVLLTDVATEPEPLLACAESLNRDVELGELSGPVVGLDSSTWSLYVGGQRWSVLPGTLDSYLTRPPIGNYDLVAYRRQGNGLANKVLIQRLLDSGNDPDVTIDFWDEGSGVPHEPEIVTLDISETGTTTTSGVFLTRGGTVVPLGAGVGGDPGFQVIADERRFWSDLVGFRTMTGFANGCEGSSLTLVSSDELTELSEDEERHGSSIVPIEPWGPDDCDALPAPTLGVGDGLSLSWSGSVDVAVLEVSGAGARWTVATTPGREAVELDLVGVAAAVGASTVPASGWLWAWTGYEAPHPGVKPSTLAFLEISDLLQSIPLGRARVRIEPTEEGDLDEARSHEYDDDDLTRPVLVVPWPEETLSAHGVRRRGTL